MGAEGHVLRMFPPVELFLLRLDFPHTVLIHDSYSSVLQF